MDFRKNGGKYLVTIEVIILIIVLVLGVLHFIIRVKVKTKRQQMEKIMQYQGQNLSGVRQKPVLIQKQDRPQRMRQGIQLLSGG